MNSETVRAYAKINLWLDITGKRPDGYHTLNTVMRRIGLYDEITVNIAPGSGITIECDDARIPCDKRNIAYKACELYFNENNIEKISVHVNIKKRIPVEAGLGGSSTDGAAVLSALDTLCGVNCGEERLLFLAARLGADVPFCLKGSTAKCTGIGEIMKPVECAPFSILLVKPDFSCSTAEAYRRYDKAPLPENKGFDKFCASLNDISYISGNMYNVFEKLYNDREITGIISALINAGALGARMTGSGSGVFGIFKNLEDARKAASGLDFEKMYCVNAL